MRLIYFLSPRIFLAGFAAILLASCSNPENVENTGNVTGGDATLKPQASQDLIYVSAPTETPNLQVYTYPHGHFVGGSTLDGRPAGLCSDANGNVYVTTSGSTSIYEIAHAATTPSRTLVQPGYFTSGCSVDPTSGNLAVADYFTSGPPGKHGAVSVFAQATGTPSVYKNSAIYWYYECAYDGKGDLFVMGVHGKFDGKKSNVVIAELPKGGNTLNVITIPQQFREPNGIQWDGKYITLSADSRPTLYRYQSSSQGLTFKDSIAFDGGATLSPYWIHKSKIVAGGYAAESNFLGVWRYPKAGEVTKTIGTIEASGVTVSVGSAK